MRAEIQIAEHGYIRLVEAWGSDERIVEAARMSTGKGFLGWGPKDNDAPGDEKLLSYLWKNRHDTPFEMAGMVVEVQAPIFVFREWHRHRVPWSYNEASARYAPLPALDYLPTVERLKAGGGHLTKQAASTGAALTDEAAEEFRQRLGRWQEEGEALYQFGLDVGVPKELARCAMSVARYSKMRASANLRGWCHFLGLRMAPNAQREIRDYAEAAAELLRGLFPRTMTLFDDGR